MLSVQVVTPSEVAAREPIKPVSEAAPKLRDRLVEVPTRDRTVIETRLRKLHWTAAQFAPNAERSDGCSAAVATTNEVPTRAIAALSSLIQLLSTAARSHFVLWRTRWRCSRSERSAFGANGGQSSAHCERRGFRSTVLFGSHSTRPVSDFGAAFEYGLYGFARGDFRWGDNLNGTSIVGELR